MQRDIFANEAWVLVVSGASRSVRHDAALPFDRLRANGSFLDSDEKKATEFLGRPCKFQQSKQRSQGVIIAFDLAVRRELIAGSALAGRSRHAALPAISKSTLAARLGSGYDSAQFTRTLPL